MSANDLGRLARALAAVTDWPEHIWRSELARPDTRLHVDELGGFATPRHPPAGRPWYANLVETVPAEAWMALATAGLVPPDAVDNPRRRFFCARCNGGGYYGSYDREYGEYSGRACASCGVECTACGGTGADPDTTGGRCLECVGGVNGRGWTPHPATVADTVLFAARWAEATAAEEIARQHLGRVRRHDILWRVDAGRMAAERSLAVRSPAAPAFAAHRTLVALGFGYGDPISDGIGDPIKLVAPPLGAGNET